MTAHPLAFDFPLMSPLSARPPHAVERAELLPELDAELGDRRAFYGRLVAKGKMNAADADRHIAILEAVRADVASGDRASEVAWDAKVRELRRELALRRNAWPRRIAAPADPLDERTAARRMERLEAIHFLYWVELFACDEIATIEQARAYVARVDLWERAAWRRGDPCVRPRMVPFYERLEAGGEIATAVWNSQLAAARKHGFAPIEEVAA